MSLDIVFVFVQSILSMFHYYYYFANSIFYILHTKFTMKNMELNTFALFY